MSCGAMRALAGALLLVVGTRSLAAQATVPDSADAGATTTGRMDAPRSWTFGAWLAGGTHEPLKTRLGHRDDRSLYILTLTGSHAIAHSGRFVMRYSPGVIPMVITTGMRDYADLDGCPPRDVCALRTSDGIIYPAEYVHTAYGAGLIPLSFDGTYALTRHVGVTFGASGGGVYFDRVIPDPYAERFNFLADGNVGLRLRVREGAVAAGFRLNHISNGNRGVVNPGMDSRLLYVAFEH